MTALLLSSIPVNAATSRTPIGAVEFVCMNTPGQEWISGNVYHLRGQIHENVVVVDSAVWGTNRASIDLDFNLKTGQLVARGYPTFVPTGADGGFSGTGTFRFDGAGANPTLMRAALQGFGDFKGQSLHLDLSPAPFDPKAGGDFCSGHGDYLESSVWGGYLQVAGG
jgi:hypothetical protein